MICEVCVDSLLGARAAIDGGAHRLELCGDLTTGGVTPSPGLVQAVMEMATVPVMVMVRPRSGDFCYASDEVQVMCRDITWIGQQGAAGIVCGALDPQGGVDRTAMARLMQAAERMSVTFHRAFDIARDADDCCQQLIAFGVHRVLTSGQQAQVEQGLPLLRRLIECYGSQMIIMPGGGVRPENVSRVIQETGAQEVHFSGSELLASPMQFQRPQVAMSSNSAGAVEAMRSVTSRDRVAAITAAAQRAAGQRG